MSKISQRYQTVFSGTLTNSGSFSHDVFVPFIPDELVVRSLNYTHDATETFLTCIYCDKINNIIAVFTDPSYFSPRTTFQLGKSINGRWNFEIQSVTGNKQITSGGQYAIVVEFIKY